MQVFFEFLAVFFCSFVRFFLQFFLPMRVYITPPAIPPWADLSPQHNISLVWRDDKSGGPTALRNVQLMNSSRNPLLFAGLYGDAAFEQVLPFFVQNRIPLVGPRLLCFKGGPPLVVRGGCSPSWAGPKQNVTNSTEIFFRKKQLKMSPKTISRVVLSLCLKL